MCNIALLVQFQSENSSYFIVRHCNIATLKKNLLNSPSGPRPYAWLLFYLSDKMASAMHPITVSCGILYQRHSLPEVGTIILGATPLDTRPMEASLKIETGTTGTWSILQYTACGCKKHFTPVGILCEGAYHLSLLRTWLQFSSINR